MEQVSPSGLILRLGAGLWSDATALLFSVHFSWISIPSTPLAVAGDDANFFYGSPFSNILHESRWERERHARQMIIEIADDLVVPDDIHFLVHAFCDYSEGVLESFYQQGGSGGHLYISLLLQIPDAAATAAAAGTTATATIGGPYDPPQPPQLPDHAIVGSSDEPSRTRLQFLSPNEFPRMYFPELFSSPVIWGGGDASVDVGNNPAASASAVAQLERVVFGAANGSCRETSCAICIDDFTSTSVLSVMPCGHGFHSACLDEWLARSNSCPLCRSSLPAAN